MAIDNNVPNSNASKNLDADNNPLYPSSYVFNEILMINKRARRKTLRRLLHPLLLLKKFIHRFLLQEFVFEITKTSLMILKFPVKRL